MISASKNVIKMHACIVNTLIGQGRKKKSVTAATAPRLLLN